MCSLNGNDIQTCWDSIVNRYRFNWLFSSNDKVQEIGEQFSDLTFSHYTKKQVDDRLVFTFFFQKGETLVEWIFSGAETHHVDVLFKGENLIFTFNVFGFSSPTLTLNLELAEAFLPLFQHVYRECRRLLKKNTGK